MPTRVRSNTNKCKKKEAKKKNQAFEKSNVYLSDICSFLFNPFRPDVARWKHFPVWRRGILRIAVWKGLNKITHKSTS